jgi:hypothetical protein
VDAAQHGGLKLFFTGEIYKYIGSENIMGHFGNPGSGLTKLRVQPKAAKVAYSEIEDACLDGTVNLLRDFAMTAMDAGGLLLGGAKSSLGKLFGHDEQPRF